MGGEKGERGISAHLRMNISNYEAKFSGSVELPGALENGKAYQITAEGQISGANEKPNEDGTAKMIYTFIPQLVELVDEAKRVKVIAKDNRRVSKRIRARHYIWHQEHNEGDEETSYLYAGGGIVKYFDEIMELIKRLDGGE